MIIAWTNNLANILEDKITKKAENANEMTVRGWMTFRNAKIDTLK